MTSIEPGLKTIDEYIVKEQDTAKNFDSGSLDILATPMLITAAERSCKNLIQPLMDEGFGTVGTLVNIRHLAPSPVGMKYYCESEVTGTEGRTIRFRVKLTDADGCVIGEGTHERVIINNKRFTEKAMRKLEPHHQLIEMLRAEVHSAIGRKALEFGSGTFSAASALRPELEYSACTGKPGTIPDDFTRTAADADIVLIPDEDLAEDCYFGRFHLVYTIFGFRGLPHLVDEIMRLRRLILKGGKMVIIDLSADNFCDECIRQLKRCGFTNITVKDFEYEKQPAFLIAAEK